MASISHSHQRWYKGYLAAYFTLLIFCFSGLVLQGGIWLLVGLTSWLSCCVVFSIWFFRYNYRIHAKCLKDVSMDKESYIEEDTGKSNVP